ncbi:MAG: NAD(P)-dependent oxidoreductase [Candidatus Thiodiazotropha sp.]
MHVLITGASGFIGSHLTLALLQRGHQVSAAVRNPATVHHLHPQAKAVAIDFTQACTNRPLSPSSRPVKWRALSG